MEHRAEGADYMNSYVYSAPSNIAIIKYMGKANSQQNLPTNASISYTLDHLRSFVTMEPSLSGVDSWEPLIGDGYLPIELSEKGKSKFLNHLDRIKRLWGVEKNFLVRSANNFPSDCGIASSSSSFAALTLAAISECQKLNGKSLEESSSVAMSKISRLGSGSSCRSFFGPWAVWDGEGAREWACSFNELNHSVMLLDSAKKEVSSSDAHLRVVSSPFFSQRLENVNKRIRSIESVNQKKDWNSFVLLAIEEFEEMHQLFETSVPRFSYRNEPTMVILKQLDRFNRDLRNRILVTMDAGNNIHLMNLKENIKDLKNLEALFPGINFLHSWSEKGPANG